MLTKINPFGSLNIFDEWYDWSAKKFWSPEIDVIEDDNSIILEADVPGVDKENIELDIKDNVLTLKGTKKEIKREKDGKKFYRYERSTGSFSRSFMLPENIKKEEIEAEFDKGVLKITIPKMPKEVPKNIKINFK
jgi:HSP20 family protein